MEVTTYLIYVFVSKSWLEGFVQMAILVISTITEANNVIWQLPISIVHLSRINLELNRKQYIDKISLGLCKNSTIAVLEKFSGAVNISAHKNIPICTYVIK